MLYESEYVMIRLLRILRGLEKTHKMLLVCEGVVSR